MKKRRILAAALAIASLIMPACGKTADPVTTDAPATDAPVITTEESGENQAMKDFKTELEIFLGTDSRSTEKAAELAARFDALTYEEKCSVGLAEFMAIVRGAYEYRNKEILSDVNAHKQEVVAAVAKAYYDQSFRTHTDETAPAQIHYDQYNNRYNFNISPEEMTNEDTHYLACSAFTNSVYYYTFGANLLPGKTMSTSNLDKEFASGTPDKNSELMFYISGTELAGYKADKAKAAEKMAEIKSVLQPGDVINYTRTTGSGHVVIYLGDRKIIHSTGGSNAKTSDGDVDPKTSIEKFLVDEGRFGTINIDDWDRFFTETVTAKSQNDGRINTSNNYLFADNVTAVAIFRPLNEKNGRMSANALTQGAIDHYVYRGIDIEKTAKIAHNGTTSVLYNANSCFSGDEITYTVTVINNSDKEMKELFATEKIPEQLEFVSACEGAAYFAADGTVAMHIASIGAGQKAEFIYTLRVKAGIAGGTTVNDAETYICGIKTNPILTPVCAYDMDSAKLARAISEISGQKLDDGVAAAKAIYAKLSPEGFACVSEQKAPRDIIGILLSGDSLRSSSKYGAMVVCTLYGGYKVGSGELSDANKNQVYTNINVRTRRVMEHNLEDGDIIVTYSSFLKEYSAVIYSAGNLYGILADGTFGRLDTAVMSSGAKGTLQDYLDTLTAYNDFLVLRPALLG